MKPLLWISCLLGFFLASVICFCAPSRVSAIVDPLSLPNNRVGIHIIDANDLDAAAALVNSNGGQWGYVTLVIQDNDRNVAKWQKVFDRMRELKLIPLVRLATHVENGVWVKPAPHQIAEWAGFLNRLNWVVANRYVILFNEPNHAKEWGGEVDPAGYAGLARQFREHLKAASADFFVLPAGLDAAAPNGAETRAMKQYLREMYLSDREIFTIFDGWVSHAYPNPNFSGPPTGKGWGTVDSFETELNLLSGYGVKTNLPVFITETGWQHNLGFAKSPLLDVSVVADYYTHAFQNVWNKPNLVAITPFILHYETPPFNQFSFKKTGNSEYFPQYYAIQSLPKTAGQPLQLNANEVLAHSLPQKLITESDYSFSATWANRGQSIWEPGSVKLNVLAVPAMVSSPVDVVKTTKPGEQLTTAFHLSTPATPGYYQLSLSLTQDGQVFGQVITPMIEIVAPPSLLVKARLWFQKLNSGSDFTLLIYQGEDLVKKITPFSLDKGVGVVDKIHGIIPGKVYRFVLTKPLYLPRQQYAFLKSAQTVIEFPRLLPLDWHQDGTFNFKDIIEAGKHPRKTFHHLVTLTLTLE